MRVAPFALLAFQVFFRGHDKFPLRLLIGELLAHQGQALGASFDEGADLLEQFRWLLALPGGVPPFEYATCDTGCST